MNCCSCCCAPIEPAVPAMRKDRVGDRAVLFIAGEASKNKADWNIDGEPKLIDKYNGLHLFHVSNTMPVMKLFDSGNAKDLWLDTDTPQYNRRNFSNNPKIDVIGSDPYSDIGMRSWKTGKEVPADMICVSTKTESDYRAVTWKAPDERIEFKDMTDLIYNCITEVKQLRYRTVFEIKIPGCKSCNDIMTQEATASHFLVRDKISQAPLVPLNRILSVYLNGTLKKNNFTFGKNSGNKFRWDPHADRRNGNPEAFTYQACLAYYIQRCMPKKTEYRRLTGENLSGFHSTIAVMSFLFLQIACLMYERYKGREGGTKRNTKAAYRYRGCTEMYLSFVFWTLLRNDIACGDEGGRQRYCTLGFVLFHRYVFLDVIKVLVLSEPAYAGEVEICDIVFDGAFGLNSDEDPPPPAQIISNMSKLIPKFYIEIVKPIFSRHVAGLEPDPTLLIKQVRMADDEYDAKILTHNKQNLVYNMIIERKSIKRVLHLVETAIKGEIDTFIENVGIEAVLARWQRMLELAPNSTFKLVQSFTDSEKLQEYTNIRVSMRPDSFQPMISNEAAETIYVMCNALELISEPNSKEELELLRVAPTCSEMKSIERLSMVGAFVKQEDAAMQIGARFLGQG